MIIVPRLTTRAWFSLLLMVIFCARFCQGQTIPKGIAVLNSSEGNASRNVVFRDLSWPNPNAVIATGIDGSFTEFDQTEITRILYFNQKSYDLMNTDQRFIGYRAGIQGRELVIETQFSSVENDGEMAQVQSSLAQLLDFEEKFPSTTTTNQLSSVAKFLNSIILKYQGGQREVSGQWMTLESYQSHITTKMDGPSQPGHVSFLTKDGRRFDNVAVQISDVGLNVTTSSGGTTIPFDQLREDGGGLPKDIMTRLKPLIQGNTDILPSQQSPFSPTAIIIGIGVAAIVIMTCLILLGSPSNRKTGSSRYSRSPMTINKIIGVIFGLYLAHFAFPILLLYGELSYSLSLINNKLPQMIDASTRMDNVSVSFPKTVVYKYTIIGSDAANFDASRMGAVMKEKIVKGYRESSAMEAYRKSGVNLRYIYFDQDGNNLMTIDVSPNDLM